MIKLNFALGRGSQFKNDTAFIIKVKLLAFSFLGLFVKRLPEALFKLVFFKCYYWQNAIIYILGPISYHLGRF